LDFDLLIKFDILAYEVPNFSTLQV